MRRQGRQARYRVRGGRRKKLRGAFRYHLEREGADNFVAELADEFPDEVARGSVPVRPADAEPQEWHPFYLRAWEALRYDRQYGAMGGHSPISFASIDAYARRYGVVDDAFDHLLVFVTAIDDEWLKIVAEKQKETSGS